MNALVEWCRSDAEIAIPAHESGGSHDHGDDRGKDEQKGKDSS